MRNINRTIRITAGYIEIERFKETRKKKDKKSNQLKITT